MTLKHFHGERPSSIVHYSQCEPEPVLIPNRFGLTRYPSPDSATFARH